MSQNTPNGWSKYEIHVIAELDRLNKNVENIVKTIHGQGLDINTIKTEQRVRSSVYGTLGGSLVVIVAAFAEWVRRHF